MERPILEAKLGRVGRPRKGVEGPKWKFRFKRQRRELGEGRSPKTRNVSPLTATLIAGLIGLVGTGFGAFIQGRSNAQLERQKFESALILKAIETGDPEKAASNLQFFVKAGFIQDPGGRIAKLSKPDTIAVLPRTGTDSTAPSCGVERWTVKTLTDPAASQVNLTPIPSTVEALRALPVPSVIEFRTPRLPQEMHTYTLTARLQSYKLERDGDFHVVIVGQSGATMIAEIPDPGCAMGSVVSATLARVRQNFVARFGGLRGAPTVIQLTGVLFFDVVHGQQGVAPNGVELHPVLDLRSP